jgi:hypothetical protein
VKFLCAFAVGVELFRQPMIFSHTGPLPGPGEPNKIPNMTPRLLSKEEMRDIAAAGGIIGVWNHGADTAPGGTGVFPVVSFVTPQTALCVRKPRIRAKHSGWRESSRGERRKMGSTA